MDEDCLQFVRELIPETYAKQGIQAIASRKKLIRILLQHKKLPLNGWDDSTIELFLNQLSMMDSNNFSTNCGLGEREGRFASALVAKRHYNFSHGIGRSGDLTEPQPKAAGSTLMYQLTNRMLQHLFKIMGIKTDLECFAIPVATGMSLVLSMLTFKQLKPHAKYVIWSRIDQKSCFKSIVTAGFIPVIIDTVLNGDQLETDIDTIEKKIVELSPENIICVMSTTSCFAPRACDKIDCIAKLCQQYDIFHLINNAYGLQSRFIMKAIQRAIRIGRVDLFVQSTDKNLMVPVGGAIIASPSKDLLEKVSETYPGRASSTPIIDVFITLLSLGESGYLKLIVQRENNFKLLEENLTEFANSCGERILQTPDNPISIAMSLNKIEGNEITNLGAQLFIRHVSGTRVLVVDEHKTISNYQFQGWGCHVDKYHTKYLTAAAAIGMNQNDITDFIKKLSKLLRTTSNITDHPQ